MERDWTNVLRELNEALFEVLDDDDREALADRPDPDWLGEPPATDGEVAAAEARLGVRFPEAYASFLRASDGWRCAAGFPLGLVSLLPAARVFWMNRDRHREPAQFREYLAANPALLDPPAAPRDDLLDRLLCVGESDGNECLLLVTGAATTDWPLVSYHPELGFSHRPAFARLFLDELEGENG